MPPTILYDGIGSNGKRVHTVSEFLAIMAAEFTNKDWSADLIYCRVGKAGDWRLQFGDWNLPEEFHLFTLDDWLEYSGAEWNEGNLTNPTR